MDDLPIIQQVREGNVDAFARLVEKYHRRLLAFISRLLGDREVAEDIGQEVFLSVYKSLNSFDETRGTPFGAWLFLAARNRCISELRSRRRKHHVPIEDVPDLASGEAAADQVLLEQERIEALRASLDQLPEPYKGSLLASLRGLPLGTIARSEGISVGTVKSRLFRAREMVRSFVREHLGGESYEGI